ncbi:MAG: hypothetical protein WCK57_06750 [Verrucomicrobiae bacterium]
MKPSGKLFIIRSVFGAVLFFFAGFSLSAADSNSAYASWIKPWSERPATSPALAAGLKLIVSNVRGEVDIAQAVAMTPIQRLNLSYHIQVSTAEVATNGSIRSYVVSNTDARTSEVRPLASGVINNLDDLIAMLPPDGSQLPPAGNRIVVQFRADGQWRVRVYDGNHLPPEVKALLGWLAKPYDKLF